MAAAEDLVDKIYEAAGFTKQHYVALEVDVDGDAQTIYAPLGLGEELSDDDIYAALHTLESAQLIAAAPGFDNIKAFTVDQFAQQGLTESIAVLLAFDTWCRLLSRYDRELNQLSDEAQSLRFRRYRPELIRFEPDRGYCVEIDAEALADWTDKIGAKFGSNHPLMTKLVEGITHLIFTWVLDDILNSPEKNRDYYDGFRGWLRELGWAVPTDEQFVPGTYEYEALLHFRLRHQIQDYDEALLAEAMMGAVSLWASALSETPKLTLDKLERVLGLVVGPEPGPNDVIIPTGDGPAAVTEGLNAAADKTWTADTDGILGYQTKPLPDGLSVRLTVSEDGRNPITVLKRAEQALEEIDPLAVQLNTLLSTQAEAQDRPWHDEFAIDTEWVRTHVKLGRLGRLSKAHQAKAIVDRIAALSRVLVQIDWIDGTEYSRTFSDLWFASYEAKWEPGQNPDEDLPYRYEMQIRPGGWAARCQAQINGRRDLLWLGHAPKTVLQQRVGLTADLQIWYLQTQQAQFTVYDWLCGALGHQAVDKKLADRKAKSKLKKAFAQAVDELQPGLTPGFDLEQTDNWVQAQVKKLVRPVQPVTISDLRRMRKQHGLSLQAVAERIPTRCSRELIRRVELNPNQNPNLARQLRELLTDLS